MHAIALPSVRSHRSACLCLLFAGSILAHPANAGLRAQARTKVPTAPPVISLRPKLEPGQVRRYRVQLQTITNTKRSGAVSDPQGPSQLAVTWDAIVKLEVLAEAGPPPSNSSGPKTGSGKTAAADENPPSAPLRVRTTYEQSTASVKSDSPDPQAEDIQQRYKQLEGRVIEFTVGMDGRVSDVRGLEAVFDDEEVRRAAEQWMAQVSGTTLAPQGVALGQSWNSGQPATSMPLAGMIWRSNSIYLRNEPCRPADTATPSSSELCAVILTHQSVLPRKQLRDPTPDDYRRNGLHTSGRWTGTGESLSYLSLQTHSAVSVTQDSSQQIDFTVTNSAGSSIHYAGTIETHSRVELLASATGDSR